MSLQSQVRMSVKIQPSNYNRETRHRKRGLKWCPTWGGVDGNLPRGHRQGPKFLQHIVISCFERRYPSKQNSVIRLKSTISRPQFLGWLRYRTRASIEKPRKKALTPEWDKHGRRQPRILADWRPDQVVSRRLRFQGYRRVVPVVHRHGVDRQSGFARPHRGPTDPLDLLLRQKYPFAVTMSTTIRYVPIIIAPLR